MGAAFGSRSAFVSSSACDAFGLSSPVSRPRFRRRRAAMPRARNSWLSRRATSRLSSSRSFQLTRPVSMMSFASSCRYGPTVSSNRRCSAEPESPEVPLFLGSRSGRRASTTMLRSSGSGWSYSRPSSYAISRKRSARRSNPSTKGSAATPLRISSLRKPTPVRCRLHGRLRPRRARLAVGHRAQRDALCPRTAPERLSSCERASSCARAPRSKAGPIRGPVNETREQRDFPVCRKRAKLRDAWPESVHSR